nr:four-carbon acid sugar kinase family protein [Caldilineaceae bacterium]
MQPISKQETFARLAPEWPVDLLPAIQRQVAAGGRKVVVLDDDPTGTQTVHDVGVLTEWSIEALSAELADPAPCVYILTNSRSLPLSAAQALNHEIGRQLSLASQRTGRDFAVVSRSDSTLRGHYPGETDALAAALGMPVDATLIVPFFLEGGRFTIDNIHYVADGDLLNPAAETPFARDAAFGYRSSDLRQWVEEKSAGRVVAADVATLSLDDLRGGGPTRITERLLSLSKGAVCIVNAASMRDMQVFVLGLLEAEAKGKHFLYRTAASFVQVRAAIESRPLLTPADLDLPPTRSGLTIVGSYVPKTTGQLGALLDLEGVEGIEVDVPALLAEQSQQAQIRQVASATDEALRSGRQVVLYTSRGLITGSGAEASLVIGQRISASLVAIVQSLQSRPRYLLAKGGITSSDIATQGLGVKRATVLGQILPGVPVWRTGPESRW